jgi:hypothetical protein
MSKQLLGVLGSLAVGVFAASSWFLVLAAIQMVSLWRAGQMTTQAAVASVALPPWWQLAIWGLGVAAPMYLLWDTLSTRYRKLVLALLTVGAMTLTLLILGFLNGFESLRTPALLVVSALYALLCGTIIGGGIWFLKTRLFAEKG